MFGRLLVMRAWGSAIRPIASINNITAMRFSSAATTTPAAATPAAASVEEALRTSKSAPLTPRPQILQRPSPTSRQREKDLKELRRYTAANAQKLPIVQQPQPKPAPYEPKPRNKKESKVFAHMRRMRLTRERQQFPAEPRPYFPPIRVNHTPKRIHMAAAAAATAPLTARVTAFLAAAASGGAENVNPRLLAAGSGEVATSGADAKNASKPGERFAVVDVNSKQHKVVEGDLIMVDRLGEVGIGDKLSFDRVLLVASKYYTVIGRPLIPMAKVFMTCEEHAFTRNLIIFKKHRRKGYRKTSGYRHQVTLLRVDKIDYDAEADTTTQLLPPVPLSESEQENAKYTTSAQRVTATATKNTKPKAAAAAAAKQ